MFPYDPFHHPFKKYKTCNERPKGRNIISLGNRAGRNKKEAPRANKVWYGKMAMGPGKTLRIIYIPVEDPRKEMPSVPSSVT